jgi:anti-anti-sigma factor
MNCITREADATVVEAGSSYDSVADQKLSEFAALVLDEARTCEPPNLVLDLTNTQYIASNFVELLIRVWKQLKGRGGVLALCGMQPLCAEVVHIMRLDSVLSVYPNRAEAVAALSGQASGERAAGT